MNAKPQIKFVRLSGPMAFLMIPLLLALVLPLLALLVSAMVVTTVFPRLGLTSRIFGKVKSVGGFGADSMTQQNARAFESGPRADRHLPDIEVQGKQIT